MKTSLYLLSVLLLFSSCKMQPSEEFYFESIDISINNGWNKSFSFFLDNEGNLYYGIDIPADSIFHTQLERSELSKLNELVKSVVEIQDSSFKEEANDLITTGIIIKGLKYRKFYIYGDEAPKNLINIRNLFLEITKNNYKFLPLDTTIKFESANNLEPPSPPKPY